MKYLVFMFLSSSCLLAQNVKSHKWEERVIIISGNEATKDIIESKIVFNLVDGMPMRQQELRNKQ